MSEIYVIWARNSAEAEARFGQMTGGDKSNVLSRGYVDLVQVEDLNSMESLDADDRYCIVFEVP